MKKIVFLVSGAGGTLKFLYYAIKIFNVDFEIVGVLADRECESLHFAEKKNIFSKKIKYTQNNVDELRAELFLLNPDIIVTNIHKIIDEVTLSFWENKFLNVHYSLLPSFGGLIGMETVAKAREQYVKTIGGTCHEVSKEVDAGKILQQGCFSVDWDNEELIIDTVFKTTCFCLLGSIYKESNKLTEFVLINNYNVQFCPSISFDSQKIDDNFWNLIKND
jgi:phosphoribosylglycinamide formyltransferase-1